MPDPPSSVDWADTAEQWSMALNDRIGDCTVAGMAHLIQLWTLNTRGRRAAIRNTAVLKRYSAVSGFVLGDPSTDVGANMRDVLKYWLKEPLNGHSIAAFAAVDIPHQSSVSASRTFRQALWGFGGLYLGLDLPLTAQAQFAAKRPWDIVIGTEDAYPNTWGGHCVVASGFSSEGVEVITWGRRQMMTWPFVSKYVSEAWALISAVDWMHEGKSPSGFDLAALQADLAAVRAA